MILGLTACSGGGTTGGTNASASTDSGQTQEEKTETGSSEKENTETSAELDGEITFGVSCAITGNFPLAGQRTKEGKLTWPWSRLMPMEVFWARNWYM